MAPIAPHISTPTTSPYSPRIPQTNPYRHRQMPDLSQNPTTPATLAVATPFPKPPTNTKESKETHAGFTPAQAKTFLTRLHAVQEALTHTMTLTQTQPAPAKNPKQQLTLLRRSLAKTAHSIASILDTPARPCGEDMALTVLSLRLRQCEAFYRMLEQVEQVMSGEAEKKGPKEMEKREWKRKGDEIKKKLGTWLVEGVQPAVCTGICAVEFGLGEK